MLLDVLEKGKKLDREKLEQKMELERQALKESREFRLKELMLLRQSTS